MNDFQTINEIVNESVRSSSYVAIAISSGVFIVYTAIIQIIGYFKARNKTKPLIEMATAIKENTANIVKLNTVLDKTFKEAERKEVQKCKNVIDVAFIAFGSKIIKELESIIIHNNIEQNKEFIVDNIAKLISTEYYKLYSILAAYEINDVNVASKLKDGWIKEITDIVVTLVYNRQDVVSRIAQLNNKVNIYISEYSTYINNKIFNT